MLMQTWTQRPLVSINANLDAVAPTSFFSTGYVIVHKVLGLLAPMTWDVQVALCSSPSVRLCYPDVGRHSSALMIPRKPLHL